MEALSLASEKSWSLALTDDSAPDDINPLFLTSLECNVLTVPLILPLHTSSFSSPLQYLVVFPLPGHFQRLLSSHYCHTLACESLTGRGKPTGLAKQLVWISPSTTKNIYSSYNEIFYNNGSTSLLLCERYRIQKSPESSIPNNAVFQMLRAFQSFIMFWFSVWNHSHRSLT